MQTPYKMGYNPRIQIIAIDGGPCGGKSTYMAKARRWLEERGYRVIIIPETATELIAAGLAPWDEWPDEISFQEYLTRYSIERLKLYYEMAELLQTQKPIVILSDRGVPGGAAYVSRSNFQIICERLGIKGISTMFEWYSSVVILVTAAMGAEQFYTLENNKARTESLEDARRLELRTQIAWRGHPHYCLIDNSTGFDTKMFRALRALARVLHMPKPREKERKFLILNYSPDMIPKDAVCIEITQDYLVDTHAADERRVRMQCIDGGASYYYTEKNDTGVPGDREEVERLITRREYEVLLLDRDPQSSTIKKTRPCFEYGGRHMQPDIFHSPISEHYTLEVEVEDLNDPIEFPSGWLLKEVTGEKQYSNREIARGSLGYK